MPLLQYAARGMQMSDVNEDRPPAHRKPGNTTSQVLVIEDNLLSLKMLRAIITAEGHGVLEATTGSQGLELAYQHHPDLIITDIRLPDISGLEVIQTLKSRNDTADIPVLGTSAHAAVGGDAIQTGGCDAFMQKPISISKFVLTLRSLLDRVICLGEADNSIDAPIMS